MVNVSNVSTTEYTYTPATSVEQKADVSIFNASNPQGSEETSKTSKLDELLKKLCAEFGLKPEDLAKITNKTAEEVENMPESEFKRFAQALETALKDSIVNGKLDINNANKLANEYYQALQNGYESIDKYKEELKLNNALKTLCEELKDSNLDVNPEELKNSGILFRISGLNKQEILKVSEKEMNSIISCLKTALIDSAEDNKVNLEKAGKLGNDYYVAVKTGWSIEGFKKYNENVKKSSLLERLKEVGLLRKDATPENIEPEELKEAVKTFFHEILGKDSPKAQLQTFGRLLINTPDEEKSMFKQAIAALYNENRDPALKAVLVSFDTPEACSAWADSWTLEEKKAAVLTPGKDGNTMNAEQSRDFFAGLTSYNTEKGITDGHAEFQKNAELFFEQNKEIIEKINQKVNNNEALTPEEQAIKNELDNFYTAYAQGEFAGTAINKIIEKSAKEQILAQLNVDALKHSNYDDVMKGVTEYIEKCAKENPEMLSMSKEEMVKLLDKTTGGNYTNAVEGKTLNHEVPAETPVSNATSELITRNINVEEKQNNVDYLKEQVYSTIEQEGNFEIETPVTQEKATSAEVYKMKNKAFFSASNIQTYLDESGETKFSFATEVFKKYGEMGSSTQKWAMNYFADASNSVQNMFLGKIANSIEGMKAAAKKVDLSKFNLYGVSVTTQKEIDRIQDERFLG